MDLFKEEREREECKFIWVRGGGAKLMTGHFGV